jgi:hypothetical protein
VNRFVIRRGAAAWAALIGLASAAYSGEATAIEMRRTEPVQPASWLQRVKVLQSYTGMRARYIDKAPGVVADRDLAYTFHSRVRLNLTGDGATYIQTRVETGNNFQTDMDPAGIGRFKGATALNIKTLFIGHRLSKNVEAQAGSMEFDPGAGSQATSGDNEGWFTGYRMRVSGAGRGWSPNKMSITTGYIGDFEKLSVFSRLPRLSNVNYVQLLVQKKLGEYVEGSSELDSIAGIRFVRAGMTCRNFRTIVLDEVIVESIARTGQHQTLGWSATGARKLDTAGRWRAGATYSDIPANMFEENGRAVLLNGDGMGLGKRAGTQLRFAPVKNFELILFASRRIDDTPGHRNRVQLLARYQLGGLFSKLTQSELLQ